MSILSLQLQQTTSETVSRGFTPCPWIRIPRKLIPDCRRSSHVIIGSGSFSPTPLSLFSITVPYTDNMTSLQPNAAGNDRFNAEAANWDNNPSVQEATRLAFDTLQPLITSLADQKRTATNNGLNVLEVGCGTGLLTLRVAPLVQQIVAVDTAEGMIDMLQSKIAATDPPSTNILPLCQLLEDPEDPVLPSADAAAPAGRRQKFDLILSHLVMHHVPDLRPFLQTLLGCLVPGGRVALTDFEDFGPEAIKFHPPSKLEGVERHGIPRGWIADLMREVGFEQVRVSVGWTLEKNIEDWPDSTTKTAPFPFLVCEGVRSETL